MISFNKQQAITQSNPSFNYVPPNTLDPWVTSVSARPPSPLLWIQQAKHNQLQQACLRLRDVHQHPVMS